MSEDDRRRWIKKFKKMSQGLECAIRSGFCSSHNCRVVRKIDNKKMSDIGEDGKLKWRMCENVVACPFRQTPGQPRAPTEHVQPTSDESKGANQKRRKLDECTMNQSHPRKTKSQVKEDILLEETNWWYGGTQMILLLIVSLKKTVAGWNISP